MYHLHYVLACINVYVCHITHIAVITHDEDQIKGKTIDKLSEAGFKPNLIASKCATTSYTH